MTPNVDSRPVQNRPGGWVLPIAGLACLLPVSSLRAQQSVFSRSDAGTNLWENNTNLPWYYQTWENNQSRPDLTFQTRNDVFFGHNNNLTQDVNTTTWFQLRSLTMQSTATSARTFNSSGGAGISLSSAFTNETSSGAHTFNTQMAIDGSTVTFTNSGGTVGFTNSVFLNSNTLALSGASTFNFSGVLSGTGGKLTKNGTGLVTFSGSVANSYDGLTTVTAGILALNKTAGVNAIAGNVTLGDGTVGDIIRLDASNQIADTSVITLVGTTVGNRGWFQLNGQNETIGGLASSTANAGLVANESNSGNSTLTLNVTGTQNFSGLIRNGNGTTGTLALVKTGNGTQTLGGTAANIYTGLTDVQAGTLAYGANDAIGSGNVKVSGGTLDIAGFTDSVGTVTLTSGLITGTTGVLTGTSGYVVESGTISAKIAGSGALTKSTGGTVSLSASNSYSGGTSINDGTLQIAASGALGTSGNITFGGGTLQYTAASQNSELANRFKNSSSAIRLDTNGASVPFGGVIDSSNTGGLIRSGTGTLQFYGSSANTYSGTTTSTGGNLYLNKDAGVISVPGDVILGDGTGDDLMTLGKSDQIADTAVVTLVGSVNANRGRFRLNGNNETIGGISSASAGAGVVENDGSSNSTLTLNVSDSQAYSGLIRDGSTGTLALIKSGSGTQTLSGTNTYTGTTSVTSGTLVIDGSTSSSSAVSVSAGTVADTPLAKLGGSGTIGGNVTLTAESSSGFKNGGVLAPSAAASGTALDVGGTTNFGTGSIFEWNMSVTNPASDPGNNAANSGAYGQLAGTGAISGGNAVFKIVLGAGNAFTDAFWNTNKTWNNLFTGAGATNTLASIFSSISGDGVTFASGQGTVDGQGYFTLSGTSTLNWTAVPEPSAALAGLLITAGLLRRRRA